jgi:hypothetical protein
MRRVAIVALAFLVLASVLTIGMRGAVNPQTIRVVDAKGHSTSYGESDSASRIGYEENFSGWYIGYLDQNVKVQPIASSGALTIQGEFQSASRSSSVAVFKHVNIDLASFPLLEARLNALTGVNYGLRFYSHYSNGTIANLWWEDSPLDHRSGVGPETIRANLEYHAALATGQSVGFLDYLELYVEAGPNTAKSFALSLTQFDLRSDALIPLSSAGEFRAAYVDMGAVVQPRMPWHLDKVQLAVTVTATGGTVLEMFLVQGSRVFSSLNPSPYVYSALNQYNEFTFYPSALVKIFPELLPSSNSSLVLLAETGSILSLAVDSLNLVFLPSPSSSSAISPQTFASYYAYLVSFLFCVPVAVALLVFWRFFPRERIGKAPIVLVAVAGLLCRFAIVPIAAHRFDINVFLTSARSWFQYGSPSGSIGPTLSLTYLFYWIPYSFYALLQMLGFHDVFLLGHQEGIVEGAFIRMFPIAADALVFMVLLRVGREGRGLVWATFYLLNPLAIYISAVWGQYDAASVALIALGIYFLTRGTTGRAGLMFVLSGMLQLIGFIPYSLTLLRTAIEKKYYTILALTSALLLTIAYWPETLLLYLIVLAFFGATKSLTLAGPGLYTLIGSFSSLSFISTAHPLILSLGTIGTVATFHAAKGKMTPDVTLLYTGLVSVALLVFSDILASWVWLLPLVLFYAALKGKEALGVFSLVFGTSTAFLMMSFTVGSRYLLTGNPSYPIVPAVESLSHGIQIFSISVTALTMILLLLMWRGRGNATRTLALTAGVTATFDLALLVAFGGLAI